MLSWACTSCHLNYSCPVWCGAWEGVVFRWDNFAILWGICFSVLWIALVKWKCLSLSLAHVFSLFSSVVHLEITTHLTELDEFKANHPDLADSVDKLPTVMMADRAPATVSKYAGAFQRWAEWAKSHQLLSLPAAPVGVACYLLKLSAAAQSPSPISSALHGIDWAHRKANLQCPGQHPTVRQVADGLSRQLSRPARKMLPLQRDHLHLLVERFGRQDCPLVDLQMLCLITLGFHGFFRWNDLQQIHVTDLHFSDGYVSVFLEGRKNDQFREGHIIPLAETRSEVCPVKWLQRFLREGNHRRGSFLFGKVTVNRHSSYVRDRMTYSCARERLKEMLSSVGLDASRFCLHSLRSGGVSAALRSPGVPVRLVQRHGGWKRLDSMEGYVEETLDNLLQVSKGLA